MRIIEKPEWGNLATFVPNKKTPVYNWFYYKEGFARELVLNCIKMFGIRPGQKVLDPFCGSGTTLLACKESGIDSLGFDVLPISVLASSVKSRDYTQNELKSTIDFLFSERFRRIDIDFPPRFKRFFSPALRDDISFFKAMIDRIEHGPVRDFMTLGFITSMMRASYVWKDGGVLKVRKHPVPPFRKFFQRNLKRMAKDAGKVTGTGNVSVDFGDARKLGLESDSVNGVITSPPYLHIIDYTKVYEIENWLIGKPMPAIRSYLAQEDTLGSYMDDMRNVIKEMARVCEPGSWMGLVVGDALVDDKPADIDLKLSETGAELGLEQGDIMVLNKRPALKHRTMKVGILRESLVMLKKPI